MAKENETERRLEAVSDNLERAALELQELVEQMRLLLQNPPKGVQGTQGIRGEKGEKGERGEKGEKGNHSEKNLPDNDTQ